MADEIVNSGAVAVADPPVATVESTPATPVVETTTTAPDPMAALREAVHESVAEGTKPKEAAAAKTPEQLAAEKAEADKKAAEAIAPKTDEEKAAEVKAAADKAAADAKAAETKVEPNPLDSLGPLPVTTLAKALETNPALAAELEKSGIDVDTLYETARSAALTGQFQEVFPTPEAAKFAGESAQHFYDIEESFPNIKDVGSFDEFITKVALPLSQIIGPDGQPLKNADGSFQTDGSIARFTQAAVQWDTLGAMGAVERLIKSYAAVPGEEGERLQAEAERVKEALILGQQFRDSGGKLSGAKAASGTRSPEDQALIDQAAKDRAEAAKTKTEAGQKEAQIFQDGINSKFETAGLAFVESTLAGTSLNDNEKRSIAKDAVAEALDGMATNRHYLGQINQWWAQGRTPEIQQRITTLATTTFTQAVTKILKREVEAYGGKVISKQQQKQKKLDTQIQNDKMNQGTGTTPGAKPAPVMTPEQEVGKIKTDFFAANGRMPTDAEVFASSLKR
jgi:hypothetical protein